MGRRGSIFDRDEIHSLVNTKVRDEYRLSLRRIEPSMGFGQRTKVKIHSCWKIFVLKLIAWTWVPADYLISSSDPRKEYWDVAIMLLAIENSFLKPITISF